MKNESVEKNNGVATIPFAAYQAAEVRWHKRLIAMTLLIGFIVAAFLTAYVINDTKWKNLFAEYDYASSEVTVDGKDGIANYIGNDGDIYNGENNGQNENAEEEKR